MFAVCFVVFVVFWLRVFSLLRVCLGLLVDVLVGLLTIVVLFLLVVVLWLVCLVT